MASLSIKKTQKSLLKKGFTPAPGTDHKFVEFHHNGVLIARTHTSHGTGEIHDGLISAMSKQCRVSSQFFKEFAICHKTKEDYISQLISTGDIIEKSN